MKILLKFYTLLILLVVFSCAKDPNEVNGKFDSQFGSQIEQMRMQRELMKLQQKKAEEEALKNQNAPKVKTDWRDDFTGSRSSQMLGKSPLQMGGFPPQNSQLNAYKSPEVNNLKAVTQNNNPQFHGQMNSNRLPEDMFELNYRTANHLPFSAIGSDFDAIKIPQEDAHNVKTEIANKPYLLVESSSIQSAADKINSNRSDLDIKESEILIKEVKKLKREKNMLVEEKEVVAKKKSVKKKNNDKKPPKRKIFQFNTSSKDGKKAFDLKVK